MCAPHLNLKECSLLIAECSTGIIYRKDLTVSFSGDNNELIYQVFDDFENAKDFAIKFVNEYPKFECVIYDKLGEYIITYDENGERK